MESDSDISGEPIPHGWCYITLSVAVDIHLVRNKKKNIILRIAIAGQCVKEHKKTLHPRHVVDQAAVWIGKTKVLRGNGADSGSVYCEVVFVLFFFP